MYVYVAAVEEVFYVTFSFPELHVKFSVVTSRGFTFHMVPKTALNLA